MKRVDIIIPLSYGAFAQRLKVLTEPITLTSPKPNPRVLRDFKFFATGRIYSKLKNGRLCLYSPGKWYSKPVVPKTSVLHAKVRATTKGSTRITGKFKLPYSGIHKLFWFFGFSLAFVFLAVLVLSVIEYRDDDIGGGIIGIIFLLIWIGTANLFIYSSYRRCREGNAMLIKWLQNIHLSDDMGGFERP